MKLCEESDINLGKKWKSSLSVKIFLSTATVFVVTCMVMFVIIQTSLPKLYEREFSNQFSILFHDLGERLEEVPIEEISDIVTEFCLENHANVRVFDENHRIIYDSSFHVWEEDDDDVIRLMISVVNKEDGNTYHIDAETSLVPARKVGYILQEISPFIFVVLFFISISISFFFASFLAKPIVNITKVSKEMSKLNLSSRCNLERSDEIGELAENLNEMADRLEKALTNLQTANCKLQEDMEREHQQEKQRSDLFTAISHELKTPLTILKGEIKGMIDKVGVYKNHEMYLQHAYETTEKMEQLVQQIMMVSQIETKEVQLDFYKINISELVNEICNKHEELADGKGISLTYYCEENMYGVVDKNLFQHAIANIVTNAIFHSPSGEIMDVQLIKLQHQGVLTVENTGTHIPEEDLENLFQPFYRADKSRNRYTGGSGLGLFIVKNILDMHQFSYDVQNSESGVMFTIKFPLG